MEKEKEDIVYSPGVIEFVAVANEFCNFLEQAGGFQRTEFIDKSRKILPLLYYKALLMPKTEALLEDGTEKFVKIEDWENIHGILLAKFGRYNDYPEAIDPVIRDTEDSVGGSISENLADIYQDIKDFIMLYSMGTVELMNDALWECMQHFDQSWGQKLLNCLRALHNLLHGEQDMEDEESSIRQESQRNKPATGDWIISQRQKLWNNEEG